MFWSSSDSVFVYGLIRMKCFAMEFKLEVNFLVECVWLERWAEMLKKWWRVKKTGKFMKIGLLRLFGCCNICPRRRLEWPEKLCTVCIRVIRMSRRWDRGIGEHKVRCWRWDTGVVIAFTGWRVMCKRLGNGGAICGKKVAGRASILRSWLTRNASGISFTPKSWYSIFIVFYFIWASLLVFFYCCFFFF